MHSGMNDEAVADNLYLLGQAFRALREMTSDDPDRGGDIIVQYLLPVAIGIGIPRSHKWYSSTYREVLSDWLADYHEPIRSTARDRCLDTLLEYLAGIHVQGACWTISAIGYRRPDVVSAVRRAARRYRLVKGDTALVTLIHLGITPESDSGLLTTLHRRAKSHWSLPLNAALGNLARPATISIIEKYWL